MTAITFDDDTGLTVPLTSGEWELIVSHEGDILLSMVTPDLQDGTPNRFTMLLGEIGDHITGPAGLSEALFVLTSQGLSKAAYN